MKNILTTGTVNFFSGTRTPWKCIDSTIMVVNASVYYTIHYIAIFLAEENIPKTTLGSPLGAMGRSMI